MSAVRKIFSRCGEAVVKGAAAERLVADSPQRENCSGAPNCSHCNWGGVGGGPRSWLTWPKKIKVKTPNKSKIKCLFKVLN